MTRATEAFTFGLIVIATYITLYLGIVPLPNVFQEKIIPVLPWWALITLGSYCLGNLGWHIMMFCDCPEEYTSLMKEIQMAKDDLRSKGMNI